MGKNKAIFLDRDGVINKNHSDYVKDISELEILSNVEKSIKLLRDYGFIILVITNQSAINRGLTSDTKVQQIHDNIQNHLKTNNTYIDKFYYCPHRPDENCDCRKPQPGLILKAVDEFDIDLQKSWLIGDSESDIKAANAVNCRSIKIEPGLNLENATNIILKSIIT